MVHIVRHSTQGRKQLLYTISRLEILHDNTQQVCVILRLLYVKQSVMFLLYLCLFREYLFNPNNCADSSNRAV
jgi:hypothetical protein